MSESKIDDSPKELGVFKSKNEAIFAKIKELEKELTDLIKQLDVEPLGIK